MGHSAVKFICSNVELAIYISTRDLGLGISGLRVSLGFKVSVRVRVIGVEIWLGCRVSFRVTKTGLTSQ